MNSALASRELPEEILKRRESRRPVVAILEPIGVVRRYRVTASYQIRREMNPMSATSFNRVILSVGILAICSLSLASAEDRVTDTLRSKSKRAAFARYRELQKERRDLGC